jgi:hypothetical protein
MLELTRTFIGDCDAVLRALADGVPFCLVRFHDGEHALLTGRGYSAASGWRWAAHRKDGPLLADLRASLEYVDDTYFVGVSPPDAFYPGYSFYAGAVKTPIRRVTFANLFTGRNFALAKRRFGELRGRCVLVGCGRGVDVKVPADAVNAGAPVADLVAKIVKMDRPVLLAAGPLSNVLAWRMWSAGHRKHPVVDMGSVLDQTIHGVPTREYMHATSRVKDRESSWGAAPPPPPLGTRAAAVRPVPPASRTVLKSVQLMSSSGVEPPKGAIAMPSMYRQQPTGDWTVGKRSRNAKKRRKLT